METRFTTVLNSLSRLSLYAVVFLVPLFWLPFTAERLEFNKFFLFLGLVLISLFCFFARAVLLKTVTLRRTPLDIPLAVLWGIFLLSSVLSPDRYISFIGDFDSLNISFITVSLWLIFYFLIVQHSVTPKQILGFIYALLASGSLAAIYFIIQTTQLVMWPVWLGAPGFNMVSSANTLFGIFLTVIFILSAALLATRAVSALLGLVAATLLLAGTALVMIGFQVIWVILALALFFMLVFFLTYLEEVRSLWFSFAFGLFVAAMLFALLKVPNFLMASLPVEFSLGSRVSWNMTVDTLTSGAGRFMLGSGPGTFQYDFSKFRPSELNSNFIWNVRFDQPYSAGVEWAATSGILGSLALLCVILILIGLSGGAWLKHVAQRRRRRLAQSGATPDSIFISAAAPLFWALVSAWLALLIAFFVVNFSSAHWMLWWLLIALIVAASATVGKDVVQVTVISLKASPQYALLTSFSFILSFALMIVCGVYLGRFYAAEVAYAQSLSAPLDKKIELLHKAEEMNPRRAVFYLSLADAFLNKAAGLSQNKGDASQVLQSVGLAVSQAKRATEIAPANVATWESLSTMYANARSIAPNANIWIITSLEKAIDLEPTNPIFHLGLGNAKALDKNYSGAITDYEKAISLKPDLLQAYIQLAFVHESINVDNSVTVLERGLPYGQANAEYLMHLGRYYFNRRREGDASRAEQVLLAAKTINPNYSDALFALAIVYESVNRKSEALALYQHILELNPGNKQIQVKVRALSPAPDAKEE